MNPPRNRRLKILEQNEIEELYSRPRFSDEEQAQYFTLTPTETAALNGLHSIKSKIIFILHLGYFKERHLFFTVTAAEASGDIEYIINRYFCDFVDGDVTVTKHTRLKHQRLILDVATLKRTRRLQSTSYVFRRL